MSDIDSIDIFREGQDQLSASDLNLLVAFIKAIKRGTVGVAPIKVIFSETSGFSISLEGQDERTDFSLDKVDSLSETGVIIPEFGGSTGLDDNGNGNVFGRTPLVDYAGSRWTFLNQGGTANGTGDVDTITSAIDTSKPFIATVSETVVSGDYVGVKTGESLLQKDFPGFRVLADTSELTGGTTALLVRRPVDGMLGKAQASIATSASGNVKLSETDGTTHGGNFSAFNAGSAVVSGDLVQLGEDAIGSVFFKQTVSGAAAVDNYYIEIEDQNNLGHKFYIKTSPCDKSVGGNSNNFLVGLFNPWLGVGFGRTGIMSEMTGDSGGAYKVEIFLGDVCPPGLPPEGSWDIETTTRLFATPVAAGNTIADGARLWQIVSWVCLTVDPIDTLLP